MRKGLTTLLVILLAVGAMLVSCKAEIGTPADELVAVSFEEGSSRGITATLEGFDKDAYYWKYAAEKADDSGLTSGETGSYNELGAVAVSEGNPGLGSGTGTAYTPYKVPGFSQGLWNFKLWAYKTKTTAGAYEDLVFYGEARNVSLSRGGDNTASVTVSPVAEGDGYIKIGTITFIPKKTGDETDQLMFIEVTNPDGSAVAGISYDAQTQKYTVPAGIYKVTVKFANDTQTIVYAEGYVIATVYSGLETLIGGDLNELITYAQFDADLNPDAVNVQAVSEEVGVGTGNALAITGTAVIGGEVVKTVSTSIERADVNTIINQMAAEQAVPAVPSGTGTTKVQLALNVDPTDATETSVTYEIGMEATLTYKESTSAPAQVSNKAITNLPNAIIIEISMQTGLSNVSVTHSGTPMQAGTDADSLTDGQYYYDDLDGKLYICTSTFSPFAINYEVPTNYVAKVGDVKYATLAAAVQKADATHAVELIADVALANTVIVDKSFTLNLNGFNITAANCRAIHVQEGTLTLTGKGTIAAGTAVSTFGDSSSVIRVGDNEGEAAGLVVGANVTISSSYCYGVSIFGKEAEGQTLVVNGKIKVTGTACAISGNGTNTLTTNTITINEGAEVYAENDYAIYHPQSGTLTVEGGTIEGKGGIETKGGNVIINGGVITATAASVSHTAYSNGASTSGYALASVENPDYLGEANIYVSGGTVNGKIIVLKDTEAAFDPVIEISGGLYSEEPLKDYIRLGYKAELNTETGYYQIVSGNLTLVEAVDATCFATGTHTYWLDEDGHKLIVDGDKIWLATDEELIIPVHNHALVLESYTDDGKGNGTCIVNLSCLKCGYHIAKSDVKLSVLSNPSASTTHTTFTVTCGDTVTKNVPFYNCLKMGGVIVLPTDDPDATYYIENNNDNINIDTDGTTFHDLYVVGCGQKISVVGTKMAKKGLRVMNRDADMVQNGTFTNVYFANVTLGAWSTATNYPNYPLFITSYNVEVGFTNVTFGGAEGKQSINVWGQQTLNKKLDGSDYPTKQYNAAVYMNFKGCDVEDNYSFMFALQGMKAEEDYYTSIHMCADSSSIGALALDGAGVSVNTEVCHDGVHNEWFLNGTILRGISGSTGIYSEVLAIVE